MALYKATLIREQSCTVVVDLPDGLTPSKMPSFRDVLAVAGNRVDFCEEGDNNVDYDKIDLSQPLDKYDLEDWEVAEKLDMTDFKPKQK